MKDKLTVESFMETVRAQAPGCLDKKTISRYMNQMNITAQTSMRKLVWEKWRFYSSLRHLVGTFKETEKENRRRIKRMDVLPYVIDHSDGTCWKFVDGTRPVLLERGNMIIPTIQRSSKWYWLDIRQWFSLDVDGVTKIRPTRKGICISIEHLEELRDLLTALLIRWRNEQKLQAKLLAENNPQGDKKI